VAPDVALVEGTLLHAGSAVPAQTELPTNATLHASTTVRLVFYQSAVVVAASSDIRRAPIERDLVLERGSVDLDGTTRVVAGRFTAEVKGTARITPRRVSVLKGWVRVFAADGNRAGAIRFQFIARRCGPTDVYAVGLRACDKRDQCSSGCDGKIHNMVAAMIRSATL
jgi:hypothetical protein